MYQLIASPFLSDFLLVRPGHAGGVKVPGTRFLEVQQAADSGEDPPAWLVDAARRVLRLMEAGHTAPAADAWARRLPSWACAPRAAVTAFSAANASAWDEIARNDPQEWKKGMAHYAHDWLTYWLG
ncbi:hypothetical protein ABZW18_28615 [Streptomyces sp. NPDC004647]|uniref:hypothetical protein n=1 Tax=Streptomyces sp. NPDC004647 TaxID=3154671 RepID=UPI0033A3CAC5